MKGEITIVTEQQIASFTTQLTVGIMVILPSLDQLQIRTLNLTPLGMLLKSVLSFHWQFANNR